MARRARPLAPYPVLAWFGIVACSAPRPEPGARANGVDPRAGVVCTPGTSLPCSCASGDTGSARCAADGSAYESCEGCGVGTGGVGAGGASTGTGGGGSTSSGSGGSQAPPFELANAVVMNSAADVATWPETATIHGLDLNADGVSIDFTKRDGPDSWPDVPWGAPGDSIEYTLWIVLRIDGVFYTSGCIMYWRGLDRNGGPPSGYAENWYYDPIRWGAMVGHQPAVGEEVGFMVTAGAQRNDGPVLVAERSNVVFIPFPADPGAAFAF